MNSLSCNTSEFLPCDRWYWNESETFSKRDSGSITSTNAGVIGRILNDSYIWGFDDVKLGIAKEAGPLLKHQIVETVIGNTGQVHVGTIGLNWSDPTSIERGEQSTYPSFLDSLKAQNMTPSLSWGYTAGNAFHDSILSSDYVGLMAPSLTLGGYDSSRLSTANITLPFGHEGPLPPPARLEALNLRVYLKSITGNILRGTDVEAEFYVSLDSIEPVSMLPLHICDVLADAYHLKFNMSSQRYDGDLSTIKIDNKTDKSGALTFVLAAGPPNSTGSDEIRITMENPSVLLTQESDIHGFSNTPILPFFASHDPQSWRLGRTFFHNAYVIADYERSQLSIHQVINPGDNVPKKIGLGPKQKSQLTHGIIAGIAVSVPFITTAAITILYWHIRKRQKRTSQAKATSGEYRKPELVGDSSQATERSERSTFTMLELPGISTELFAELFEGSSTVGRQEIEGDWPYELQGRPITGT